MDSHRLDSLLQRIGTAGKRAGADRVPGMGSAFRWFRGRIAARPATVDHHGFELYFVPTMTRRTVGVDGCTAEPKVDAALRSLASTGDVVVDIGGFLGYHTLALRRAVGASGHVVVFEPHPDHADLINRTIGLNDFENVTLERVAVGASAEQTVLSVPQTSRSMASTTTGYDDGLEFVVETVTLPEYLDDACLDRIDVAKIDIEGGEHGILCETDALDRIDALVCEIHPHALEPSEIDAIVQRLTTTGTVTDLDGDPLDHDDGGGPIHAVWESE